ncbi:PDZ domain-containing protein 4-like isoform X2 [Pristis pectinata]|uniref:PDZ domain-containing protein 4-like isoform X2 n=1 Tax=Pristis pectinata TaxID=685728 RepID=UPI00223E3190|nr:PDZ domain-containing protein 4-like isoform X2 [Pristis pectinata]
MGCNMCVVEKAEEQNKGPTGLRHGVPARRLSPSSPRTLHGKEACKVSQEPAAETLRPPREPLVIQVMRRSPRGKVAAPVQDPQLVDNGTQTEITFEHIMALSKVRPPSPPPVLLEPYVLSDLPPLVNDFYEANDYMDSGHHEVDRADDLEYEEVELYKERHQEKLGLTVCYRTDDENDTGIYIGEINPNGIAAKDGRIRTGDRIIQINGVEVQNREEAVAILTREDSTNVSLLLARPEIELDEGWMEERGEAMEIASREEGEESLAGLSKAAPAKHKEDEEEEEEEDEDEEEEEKGSADAGNVLSNSQELDSGVGRTDESTRNDESSEHDILADEQASTTITNVGNTTPGSLRRLRQAKGEGPTGRRRDLHLSTESLPGLTEEECLRYRELLELRCHLENGNAAALCYRAGRGLDVNRNEGVGRLAAMLQEELGHLEFKCRNVLRAQKMQQLRERCMKAWLAGEGSPFDGGGGRGGGGGGLCDITELPERSDRDSTSAYNTGESCRSTPLLAEPSAAPPAPPPPGDSPWRRPGPTTNNNLNLAASPPRFRSLPRQQERSAAGRRGPRAGEGSPYLSRGRHRSPGTGERYRSCVQLTQPGPEGPQPPPGGRVPAEGRSEWKVKVRSDGSRYVAKRPVRDKLLKARALKIREERSGMTTDDDAVSEMKMGRYWSKEERKQHLARAREQRRRREFMLQSRLDCLKEQQASEAARSELSIIALSHKKTMKRRNRRILDNWMTIQEMLAHGTRTADGKRVYNPLLSVTTV